MAIITFMASSSSFSSPFALKRSLLFSAFMASFLLLLLAQRASSDLATDKAQCADHLIGLATCLAYVQGTAKAPTPDCCAGIKDVIAKSPKCLCLLIQYHADPDLGLQINVSLALGLPDVCHAPANISKCPELLNLPPNSKDAQIFEQKGNSTQGNSTASPAKGPANSKAEKNSGSSDRLRWIKGYPKTMSSMADIVVEVVGSIILMAAAPFLLSI